MSLAGTSPNQDQADVPGESNDGVFMTSLRVSGGELPSTLPISHEEPIYATDTATAINKERGSLPASLIASSENPLHSPSESEYDPEDVADLLSAEDGFDGSMGGMDSLGGTGKYSGGLLSDSLLGQNPLITPSDSPATSDLGDSSAGADMRGLRLDLGEAEEQQAARREELENYMGELQSRADEDGESAVVMPADFSRMVSDILADIRPKEGEKDWLTLAREDAAAVAEKNASKLKDPAWMKLKSEDPKVLQALDEAIALDKRLREKQIEAMIAWRETHPEEWEAQRKKKEEQRRKKAEEAIKAERKRRQHQARLQRAMNVVESYDKGDHMSRNAHLGPDARYFKLQPEEEVLVEKLLEEEETEDDTCGDEKRENPFELQIVPVDIPGFDLARDTVKKLADIDAQLSSLAQDHLFDETGSMVDFRSSTTLHAGLPAGSNRPPSALTSLSELDVESHLDGPAPSLAPSSVAAPPPSVSKPLSKKGPSLRRPQSGNSASPSQRAPSEISERSRMVQDYLTEQRLQREAAEREKDLDTRLRQLRVSELPDPRSIPQKDLKALIADCRRAQEAREAHTDAIDRLEAPTPPALLIPPESPEQRHQERSPVPGASDPEASGREHEGASEDGSTFVTSRAVLCSSPTAPQKEKLKGSSDLVRTSRKQTSARRDGTSMDEAAGNKIVWRSPPSPARPPSTDRAGPSLAPDPASPSSALRRRDGQQQQPQQQPKPTPSSRPSSSHGLPPASPSAAIRTSASRKQSQSSSSRPPSAQDCGDAGEQPRPRSSTAVRPQRSISSSGPTRSLAERQRRSSESASIPLFVPGEGILANQSDAPRVILHHHSAAGPPATGKKPALGSTITTARSGRRSRDGSAGRRPASANEGLVVDPVLKSISPAVPIVDPLQNLGAERSSLQRVASAGRRAGLLVTGSQT